MRSWIPKTGDPIRIPLQDFPAERAGPPVRIVRTQHTPNTKYTDKSLYNYSIMSFIMNDTVEQFWFIMSLQCGLNLSYIEVCGGSVALLLLLLF